ncbi:MAG: hypothetical protein ABI779_09145, partial [Acidobacteriota bacterium]
MKIIFKRSHSAILVVALLLAAACSSQRQATSLAPPTLAPPTLVPPLQTDLRETPDPDNVIHTLRIEDGKLVASSSAEIPKDAFSFEPFDEKDERSPEVSPPQKIHPLLEKWIASRDPDAVEAVIINFRDTVQVPRFPEPAVNEPRDSPTNKRVLARNAEIIAGLRAKRADDDSAMEEK